MSNNNTTDIDDIVLIVRIAHVVGRLGLAMAGAMCGTFVAAQLTVTNAALFDSTGVIALIVLLGTIGFYFGVDIPRLRVVRSAIERRRVDPVDLLSTTGTFLAAIAALISVYAFVFDEIPAQSWEYTVASWWVLGVALQLSAGFMGRICPVKVLR
jgi:hypothetical protein